MKNGFHSFILCLFVFTAAAAAEMKVVEVPQSSKTRTVRTRDPQTGKIVTKQVPVNPETAENESVEPELTAEEIKAEKSRFDAIELPEQDSPEYWMVRSEAITELLPVLTQKRSEMKKKRQMLADYLLQIGKGEDMASQNIEVPDDPKLYAQALGIDDVISQKDIDIPGRLPSWEETAEFAMRFIIDEGFIPMQFDGSDDLTSYIELVKKKEQYAQKVRREMRGYVKDTLKMWIYLGNIGGQAKCKEWAVQMKVDAEVSKNAERAMLSEERRMAALDRQEAEKQQKFDDAQDRASFRSTRRQRHYQSRDDRLRYQQTLLNSRYTNYYRW